MTARRDFLRGLVSLPLIGGSIGLIGRPSAVAEPVTSQLMFEYAQWLSWERVAAYRAIHGDWSGWADAETRNLEYHRAYSVAAHLHGSAVHRDCFEGTNAGLRSNAYRWHHGASPAPARAALVLSTVGCDWRPPYAGRPSKA